MKQKNIVVIGGGTGTYTVLMGLKKYPVSLTAVVSMADDGGSSKILREEFGILPPGSVRPALVALSNAEKSLADLWNFRFHEGKGLNGHSFGNLFLTALSKQLGSFEKAIDQAGKILHIKGRVIPSTLQDCHLVARLENGSMVRGEVNIDVPKHDGNIPIAQVWLDPPCKANPKAIQALKEADLIVIGPGDLFSSILPNFLVKGIRDTVRKSRAKKVYVCNLMTKFGETMKFRAMDFVTTIEKYLGANTLDYVILNKKKPSPERVKKYEKEKAEFVSYDLNDFRRKRSQVLQADLLRSHGFIRHDSDKLAKLLISLM